MALSLHQQKEAKQTLDQIHKMLRADDLTPEQRKQLQLHAAALAGALLHPWFPVDWVRRGIMIAIVFLGVQQGFAGNYEAMLFWLVLPLFSPRLVV